MRVSDRDRDRVAEQLREGFAEGRLTQAELEQRLDQLNVAQTHGDLTPITGDLPVVPRRDGRGLSRAWAAWVGVSVLVNVIWLATWITDSGSRPSYWPIWVMGPWGAAMLIGTLTRRWSDE